MKTILQILGLAMIMTGTALAGPVYLKTEHVDLGIDYISGSWDLTVNDHDHAVAYNPTNAVLEAGVQSELIIPNNPSYFFLGDAGDPIWILPQTQNANLLFLGTSAYATTPGALSGSASYRLLEVKGPNDFFVYTSGLTPSIKINSRDGITTSDYLDIPAGSHSHYNWAFGYPGVYKVKLQALGLPSGGTTNVFSAPQVYTFRVLSSNPYILFDTPFRGTGTGMGGASDIVDFGGTGKRNQGANGQSINVVTSPSMGDGKFLRHTITTTNTVKLGNITITPLTKDSSWGQIIDRSSGQWILDGGFDFFVRPNKKPGAADHIFPLNLSSGTGGITLKLRNSSATKLQFSLTTPTGGGGKTFTGNYTFTSNQVHHVGVTFSTDVGTGISTIKLFAKAGTNSIDTTSNTVGTGGLIAKGTMNLVEGVATNSGGFLGGANWKFGDTKVTGYPKVNDYDRLRLYDNTPGLFPSINE